MSTRGPFTDWMGTNMVNSNRTRQSVQSNLLNAVASYYLRTQEMILYCTINAASFKAKGINSSIIKIKKTCSVYITLAPGLFSLIFEPCIKYIILLFLNIFYFKCKSHWICRSRPWSNKISVYAAVLWNAPFLPQINFFLLITLCTSITVCVPKWKLLLLQSF